MLEFNQNENEALILPCHVLYAGRGCRIGSSRQALQMPPHLQASMRSQREDIQQRLHAEM